MNSPRPNTFDAANARELCAASAAAYETAVTAERAHLDAATAVGRRCRSAETSGERSRLRSPRIAMSRPLGLEKMGQSGSFALPKLAAVSRCAPAELSANAKLKQTGIWSDATDTHVLITRRDDDLIVAFRGTADLRNWLTDLDCELIRVGNCRFHRGFYEAMKAVEPDLSAELGEAQGVRLWVTGHSLGGALAMLWALWAVRNGYEIAGVYTFGQPRAGDAAFSQLYDSKLRAWTWRSVHAEDIVPRLPWLLRRYRHAGHEAFYPLSAPPLPVLDRPFWTRLPSEARGLARELCQGKLALLADHHVSRYLALFPETRAADCILHS